MATTQEETIRKIGKDTPPSLIPPRSIATHLPVAKTPSVRRAFGTAGRQPTIARSRRSTKWALASPLRSPPTRPWAARARTLLRRAVG